MHMFLLLKVYILFMQRQLVHKEDSLSLNEV